MAKEWGVKKDTDGYANCYELDCNGLDILNLNDDQYCILHWLAILLQNREFDIPSGLALEAKEYILDKFSIDYERYDAIIGYRADNSYFSFAQDFVAGVISLQKLSEAMQLGKLGEQIVLKSPQAFEKIQYVKSEPVDMQAYYIKKIERERAARKEYRMSKRQKADLNELFILDIMREEMENDDPRLF